MKRQTVLWPVLFALAVALIAADLADAQQVAIRNTTRGLMWNSFRDIGSMGRRNDSFYDGAVSLQYPGTRADIGDFIEYYGDPGWNSGGGVTRTHHYSFSVGEGVWMLVKDGNDYVVTSSGPRYYTEDLQASVYDPRTGSEKDLGIQDGKSTWWPTRTNLPDDMIEIHNYTYGKYIGQVVGRDNEAEEVLITRWRSNKSGLITTRKSRAWSYPDYMDFLILEFVFENGSAKSYTDVYFALVNNWAPTESAHDSQGSGNNWRGWADPNKDDGYRYTEASNYAGPAQYRGKKMLYMWDGDYPRTLFDDTGGALDRSVSLGANDWGQAANELLAPAYLGMAPLAWKPPFANDAGTYVAPKGDQPQSAHWWKITNLQVTDEPTNSRNTDAQMYAALTAPTPADPTDVDAYANALTFGPYDMAPGDKAKIVMVYVAGAGADFREQTWGAGYTGPKVNMGIAGNLNAWSLLGDRAELKKGEDAMFNHLAKAQFAYNNGYDVPDAPPDVKQTQSSTPEGNFQVAWTNEADSAVNPDYAGAEANDIAGYRVYRAQRTNTGAPPREIGPWDLVDEAPVGKNGRSTTFSGNRYTFVDKESVAGFTYFYTVHSFAKGKTNWSAGTAKLSDLPQEQQDRIKGGLEGGFSSPESKANYLPLSPSVPSAAEFDQLATKVRVVPNPYKVDGQHNYPGDLRVRFVNLPRRSTISIYSVSGDLQARLEHNDPTSGEEIWRQQSRTYFGEVASGIYFFVVESHVPGSEGKKQSGTFAIIKR